MSTSSPTVSIGLPVYNGERFLAESIESILGQTFADFELIISDNGSNDRTQAICSAYVARDARIRYQRSETNQGASRNYNRTLELARGKYFRWAPADDKFAPASLQRCVEVLDENPGVVLCYPQTILIDDMGNPIGQYDDNMDLRAPDARVRFYMALCRNGLINAIYGLMRTGAVRCAEGMGGFPGADVALLAELSLYGSFREIPAKLFFRRIHGQSSTSLQTLDDVQQFFNPLRPRKFIFYLWRHAAHHARAILRAPASGIGKIQLMTVLLRWMVAARIDFATELLYGCRAALGWKERSRLTQGGDAVASSERLR